MHFVSTTWTSLLVALLILVGLPSPASAHVVAPTSCTPTNPGCFYIPGVFDPVESPYLVAPAPSLLGSPTLEMATHSTTLPLPEDVLPDLVDPASTVSPIDGLDDTMAIAEDPSGIGTAMYRILRFLTGPVGVLFGTLMVTLSGIGAFINARRGRSLLRPAGLFVGTIIGLNMESILAVLFGL